MKELFKKILSYDLQPDILVLLVFASTLFWVLLWTAKREKFEEFFKAIDKTGDIHLILGTYVVICYTVYAGYVAFMTKSLPDFPYVATGLVLILLGLVAAKDIIAIWRGASTDKEPPK